MQTNRFFLIFAGLCSCTLFLPGTHGEKRMEGEPITLFLCGDVMTGRGIDQILPYSCKPRIYESYVKNAKGYVELAERVNGPINRPVDHPYIWGDALDELGRVSPDVRIINLETSVTVSEDYWRGKGIHYRMHPKNIPCITAAGIDCCALANNHVLDWGYEGLAETLDSLTVAKVKYAGAGRNSHEAEMPAFLEVKEKGRVVLFSYGHSSSGIARDWEAMKGRPGVNRLHDLSDDTVRKVGNQVAAARQAADVIVVSIHWGGNWGYDIPADQKAFAHRLVDEAEVDIIYGHSSHHVKGIEVYKGKLILYGCGDFLNDYEGIGGYDAYRSDLSLMYFPRVDPVNGKLVHMRLTPMQIKRFKANRTTKTDALWLRDTLNREGKKLGTRVELNEDNSMQLKWD